MPDMIDLAPGPMQTVRGLLAWHVPDCEVRAFGSRVCGHAKPHSDLDLVVMGPGRLPHARIAALREALEDSDLPIRVDVLYGHAIPASFRANIQARSEVIQRPKPLQPTGGKPDAA